MKVLVVDDNDFSRGVLKGLILKLAPAGCEVTESDTASVSKIVQNGEHFDLATVDGRTAGKDSLSLALELKQRGVAARLTLISSDGYDTLRTRAESLGIGLLSKPLSEAKLARLVAS